MLQVKRQLFKLNFVRRLPTWVLVLFFVWVLTNLVKRLFIVFYYLLMYCVVANLLLL